MEIFQTIWTTLATENIQLIKIFTVFFCLIEGYLTLLLLSTIFSINLTKKQKILYVLLMSISGFITKFIIPNPYNTFVNVVLFLLINIIIFKLPIFKGILSVIIPFILTILLESFVSRLYYIIFHTNYLDVLNIPFNRLMISSAIYIFEFIIYFIIKRFKISFSKLEINNTKTRRLLIITSILGIILIADQLYLLTFYSASLPMIIMLLSMLGLVTYFFISLYSIFTASKLETTTANLEEAQLYNKTLQILHDNIRGFKHDFWNIVQGIGGYVDKNDMEGLKQYYSKLIEDCQQVNNLTALSPSVVNNPAIYNVLANKYHMADELGIKINLEVFMDLNELSINSYELTRIIGILMNNAIEASKECKEKVINVTFRKDKNRHMQLVIVENTYKDKNIDTEKIYEKGYSTKEGNTGLGLWEIRQIMKKHNNLNLYTTKTDDFFSQQFEIYY